MTLIAIILLLGVGLAVGLPYLAWFISPPLEWLMDEIEWRLALMESRKEMRYEKRLKRLRGDEEKNSSDERSKSPFLALGG